MLDHQQMIAFVSAAKFLSFAKAAEELRTSPSQISKLVKALEDHLSHKLFVRTTRSVRLTVDGDRFLPLARAALNANRDAEQMFREKMRTTEISGSIRSTCSHSLALHGVSAAAASFIAKYPRVSIDLHISDSYVNLVDEEIDVAIRVMHLTDSSLICKKVADNPVIFCASPSFLKGRSKIQSLKDMETLPLFYIPQHGQLHFKKSKRRLDEIPANRQVKSTNGDVLVDIAKRGVGIVARSKWSVVQSLREKSLVQLDLDDELVSSSAVYLVFVENRFMPLRVRLWIDHLSQSLKQINSL